ncbi:MAG TPA: zf-HC2 domain-containing protein, partial [Polyangia bacterium]|nr:zf-HC2 domain-containing protein [Polyangia bacterium]
MTNLEATELVCQEVVELVTDYLAGALPPAQQARFELHLQSCPPCTAYLAQIRVLRELAAELGAAAPPADGVA